MLQSQCRMVRSGIILILSEDHSALEEMMTATLAGRLARLGALSGDSVTNQTEAQRLIDSLFACANAEYTNSGRRIISIIPIEELEKRKKEENLTLKETNGWVSNGEDAQIKIDKNMWGYKI